MKIKITDDLQYEVASAKKVEDTIVAVTESGEEIIISGDLSTVEIVDGELTIETEPTPTDAERIVELEAKLKAQDELIDILLGVNE